MKKGFTLMETMVVVIIVGVLATIGLAQYSTHREAVLDKEAVANLKIIQSAERIYRMEIGAYVPCNDAAALNNILRLLLPGGASPKWEYRVADVGAAAFIARARRAGRVWCLDQAAEEPSRNTCAY
jgi:prepilin-type N-terminal cleavage/methylation domain-containing protein